MTARRSLFWALTALCLLPWIGLVVVSAVGIEKWSAPICLLAGMVLALTLGNPYEDAAKRFGKVLLQTAVILLGFAVDFHLVLQAGLQGLGFAAVSIVIVFLLGWGLGRALKIRPVTTQLVTTGTAICGGSAIAAMSSVLGAEQEDISISVGAVFLLNAIALFAFPPLGHSLGLTDRQFGVWSGIAIHDVSSVVGAATVFGGGALAIATSVKLARVLYLVPVTLVAAAIKNAREKAKIAIPWFVGLFLVAAALRSGVPALNDIEPWVKRITATGFSLALFLIGVGISRDSLKKVGARPLILAVVLWVVISLGALMYVKSGGL